MTKEEVKTGWDSYKTFAIGSKVSVFFAMRGSGETFRGGQMVDSWDGVSGKGLTLSVVKTSVGGK